MEIKFNFKDETKPPMSAIVNMIWTLFIIFEGIIFIFASIYFNFNFEKILDVMTKANINFFKFILILLIVPTIWIIPYVIKDFIKLIIKRFKHEQRDNTRNFLV